VTITEDAFQRACSETVPAMHIPTTTVHGPATTPAIDKFRHCPTILLLSHYLHWDMVLPLLPL